MLEHGCNAGVSTVWNILFMAPIINLIVVFFTYFGAISLKRMRRFDLLTTDLGHIQPMRDQDL